MNNDVNWWHLLAPVLLILGVITKNHWAYVGYHLARAYELAGYAHRYAHHWIGFF